jgi:CheY-like chemotaxis protein
MARPPVPGLGLSTRGCRANPRSADWGVYSMAEETAAEQGTCVALRILVVDDSPHFRDTARELLAQRGLEIMATAADGEAALAVLAQACPDGVLLDINLPGRYGYAVAASIVSVCPATTIVLTSSDVDDVPTSVLKHCGASAFVPKTELAAADLERLFVRPEGT